MHETFKCPLCCKSFLSIANLCDHLRLRHGLLQYMLSCLCGKRTESFRLTCKCLIQHAKDGTLERLIEHAAMMKEIVGE